LRGEQDTGVQPPADATRHTIEVNEKKVTLS
jgi:hypothetical protein